MPSQSDGLTILGLGLTVLFGVLRMNPCGCYTHLLVWLGYGIITLDTCVLVWSSQFPVQLVAFISILALGFIVYDLAMQTYRSARVGGYVSLYERNRHLWDPVEGNPYSSIPLKKEGKGITLRKAANAGPAFFTPVVGTLYDQLAEGVEIFITINSDMKPVKFFLDQQKEWRPMWSTNKAEGQRFIGKVDEPIRPGRIKKGPDELLRVSFPPSLYTIDYHVEGESKKGCHFELDDRFYVEIY